MIILYALLTIYILWVTYLAVMNLQGSRDRGTLPRPAYIMGLPLLYLGLFLDALVNITVLTILMWEIPKEWLVTSRVSRHCGQNTRRGAIACWLCDNLLNPFDPSGKHCK